VAEGQTQPQVAKAVGCHRSTIARWVAREDFQEAVARFRRDMTDATSEAVRETAKDSALEIGSQLLAMRQKVVSGIDRHLNIVNDPETELNIHRSVPSLNLAAKITGLEDPSLMVESQLDLLKPLMPPESFDHLLAALECLHAPQGSGNGR